MFKKVLASILLGVASAVLSPIAYSPVAEAEVITVDCGNDAPRWEVTIYDETVEMLSENHAHVAIQRHCLDTPRPFDVEVVDVMWGRGYICNDLNTGKPIRPSDVALAIANYMSTNY